MTVPEHRHPELSEAQRRRIDELMAALIDRPVEAQLAHLDEHCADDTAVRAEVESLLAECANETSAFVYDPPQPATPGLPAEIGGYRIVRQLGEGGMGVVYLATSQAENIRRRVAIKVVRHTMNTESVLRRFDLERRMLASIDHPNIAKLFDAGATDDGRPYFVMEYIEGQSINEYCDGNRLSISERLRLFQKVCDAVDCVNRHMIIHRDLKPANIIVTSDGQPRLLDFGIAKFVNPDLAAGADAPTSADARPMTLRYASPEQVRGVPLTTASDVYALGVLLYEILSGHAPYHDRDASQMDFMKAVCEEDPDAPSTAVVTTPVAEATSGVTPIDADRVGRDRGTDTTRLRRQLRGDLDHIVMRALRKEPHRRYQSARELAEDIDRHLEGYPVHAGADTLFYRASKFVRRNRVAVAALAFVVLSLVVGISGTSVGFVQAAAAREAANDHLMRLAEFSLAYIDDLEDKLEVLDNTLETREEYARKAVESLEYVVEVEGRNAPEPRIALARSYRRLGEIRGGRDNPNGGDVDEMMRWYEKSDAEAVAGLLDYPGHRGFLREHALTQGALVDVFDDEREYVKALELSQLAHETLEGLANTEPDHEDGQLHLAAALLDLGRAHRRMWTSGGRRDNASLEEADDRFRESLALRRALAAEDPRNERAQYAVSVALGRVANVRKDDGDFADALGYYEESRRIREQLFEQHRGNARYRRGLATVRRLTAQILWTQGDTELAMERLEQAMDTLEEVYRLNDDDNRARKDLAGVRLEYGLNCIELERWDDAEASLQRSYSLSRRLYDDNPRNSKSQNFLVRSRWGLARVMLERDRPAEAVTELQAAIEVWGARTPRMLTDLAYAYEARGDRERARAIAVEAKEAWSLNDRSGPYWDRLDRILEITNADR